MLYYAFNGLLNHNVGRQQVAARAQLRYGNSEVVKSSRRARQLTSHVVTACKIS